MPGAHAKQRTCEAIQGRQEAQVRVQLCVCLPLPGMQRIELLLCAGRLHDAQQRRRGG
jgi:hypothetical protein